MALIKRMSHITYGSFGACSFREELASIPFTHLYAVRELIKVTTITQNRVKIITGVISTARLASLSGACKGDFQES